MPCDLSANTIAQEKLIPNKSEENQGRQALHSAADMRRIALLVRSPSLSWALSRCSWFLA